MGPAQRRGRVYRPSANDAPMTSELKAKKPMAPSGCLRTPIAAGTKSAAASGEIEIPSNRATRGSPIWQPV